MAAAGLVVVEDGHPQVGHWLKYYWPDAQGGQGVAEFTADESEAQEFETPEEAWEFWRQQSTVKPLREDGRPNRPLTALTVSIEEL